MGSSWKLLAICALFACQPPAPPAEDGAQAACGNARVTGRLPREIAEASGIAASRRTPGIFWVHSDEPAPLLFGIDSTGAIVARVRIRDLLLEDWEDIAAGPCGAQTCLYLADTGDNDELRASVAIYRIVEPLPADSMAGPPERLSFRYPDGPRDAEALFVTPDGELYIVTKGRSGGVDVYVLRWPAGRSARTVAQRVAVLRKGQITLPDLVTGAAATPDGAFVVVRTYAAFQVFRFEQRRITPVPGAHFDVQPLGEVLGEGIDIRDDGTVFLVSEGGTDGRGAPVSRVECVLDHTS